MTTHRDSPASAPPLEFSYTNHRGERRVRRVDASTATFWHGESPWHVGKQWFLSAFCLDQQAMRDFALRDARFTVPLKTGVR